MPDREKVINHFEDALSNIKPVNWWVFVRKDFLSDAIVMLKAQEPRVLTLEEVHEMAWDYCYLEEEVIKDKVLQMYSGKYRIKCITWPSIASCVLTFGDNAYGKRWRCWTSRPTEEQRKAVKWDD